MSPAGAAGGPRDSVVVFLTHQWSDAIGHRFLRLHREMQPAMDCFVILQGDSPEVLRLWTGFLQANEASAALFPFRADALPAALGYPYYGDRRILGNTHFPLFHFARSHAYRHYWQVEGDVEYRGSWRSFLGAYDQCETPLMAAHLHRFRDWPTWHWWPSLSVPAGVTLTTDDLYKAFLPVLRISRTAIDAVEEAHRAGWRGHFEVLIPTVLVSQRLGMQDLCAVHPCYAGPSQDPCAILPLQSTLRHRPEVSMAEFQQRGSAPLIFHPVKENWTFDGEKIVHWKGAALG
jgi:hypothetical protein